MSERSTPGRSFGEILRELRREAQLTQTELAEHSGVSTAAIRDLEQGRSRCPSRRSVRALATVLERTRRGAPSPFAASGTPLPPRQRAIRRHPDAPVRLGILGTISVHHGELPVPVGFGRHRVVLARLALSPNRVVTRADLIDVLWSDRPPPSALNLVHRYIARIRHILEPHRPSRQPSGAITLVAGGYRLNAAAENLDMLAHDELVARAARTEEPEKAFGLLGRAMEMWRGEPVADVPELHQHADAIALSEARIDAALRYADLARRLGRARVAVRPLTRLAAHHPLHEPLHAALIAVLCEAGHRAAATQAFDTIRRRLADELGIGPGADLVRTHGEVLHDG